MRKPNPLSRWTTLFALLAALSVLAAGCGSSPDKTGEPNQTDQGFVDDMTPHHESAIQMANIATTRAEHPEIGGLAQQIIAAQKSEIGLMAQLKKRYAKSGADGHATLALDEQAMGMSMDTGVLKTAKPFDRAFIDMMVPHHMGAITMAKVELSKGMDAQARDLAQRIVTAQQGEIGRMNDWRKRWYGAPVPAHGMSMGG